MIIETLEEMRIFERFNNISILPECFFAIRVDGRSFHSEVERMKMKRPFDKKLRRAINKAVKVVMKDFGSIFAYTESDEVTFLFPKTTNLFDRRLEKLVSLVASKMSVEFAKSKITIGTSPTFDARVLELPTDELVIKCFQWRQMDSHRNAISTQCFWRLVKSGETKRNATRILKGMKDSDKNELLFSRLNCNYNNTPEWTRKGTMFFIKEYVKKGFNPVKNQTEKAIRKKIVCEDIKVFFREDNLDKWLNKGIKILM